MEAQIGVSRCLGKVLYKLRRDLHDLLTSPNNTHPSLHSHSETLPTYLKQGKRLRVSRTGARTQGSFPVATPRSRAPYGVLS